VGIGIRGKEVQIEIRGNDDGAELFAFNPELCPVTLTVAFSRLVQAKSTPSAPVTIVLQPGQSRRVLRIQSDGPGKSWEYQYVYEVNWGSSQKPHNGTYGLPFAPGERFKVMQGYSGDFSHEDRHAVDFEMPIGTPVHAARDGLVVEVTEHHHQGGNDPALDELGNELVVYHADGSVARYTHFRPHGISVDVGQRIRRGQRIGFSGNTGFSSDPHLHFQVEVPIDGFAVSTVWTAFENVEGATILAAGEFYTRP
jgi:murein DD-endopeptidase MepM/ murein hydrolase activator NlpD